MKSPIVILIPLAAAAALLSGACGYHFGTGWSMPEGVDRIYVAVMKNRAHEPGFETMFSNYLIDELNRYTEARISPTPKNADAVLDGEIIALKTRTVSSENIGEAIEKRITVSVSLSLKNKSGKIIWAAENLSGGETYRIGANMVETEHRRRQALDTLSEHLAQRALEQLTLSARVPQL